MNLTGKQLVEQGIITGPIKEENIQQHGVDLNLIKVEKISGTYDSHGSIPRIGKTQLAYRTEINIDTNGGWLLQPGSYDITLDQGCKIPPDKMLLICQRSSLLRNGTLIQSSIFDAGFETDKIGTVMIVHEAIWIEKYARVAQIYALNSNVVENLYSGQWQGDKQRTATTLNVNETALQ